MPDPPTPAEAEERFRELLDKGGLPEPDRVEERDGEIVFLWDEQKLAIVLELEVPLPPKEEY